MNKSRDRAQKTVGLAANAGSSLEGITQAVARIKDMNTMIAAASEEINKSVTKIQQTTQETVSSSGQTMSSCNELAKWGEDLQQIVNQFKI